MNKYELQGEILAIFDTQTFESGFQKREFVVEVEDGKYPQPIKLELIKDKCADLDAANIGDEVRVHFNLRGNEYKGRYYANLQAWRIERLSEAPDQAPAEAEAVPADDDGDDIPF